MDFSEPLHRPKTLPGKEEAIDLILPCYNPQEGWERLMIEKHAELVKMLKGRSFRFIVVNDASKRGFTKDAVGRLLEALPDTMIVSYDTNKGKGAAVRAGLSHSTSSITLYTDYDFPYETDSICRMVEWLESGYDVVYRRAESYLLYPFKYSKKDYELCFPYIEFYASRINAYGCSRRFERF